MYSRTGLGSRRCTSSVSAARPREIFERKKLRNNKLRNINTILIQITYMYMYNIYIYIYRERERDYSSYSSSNKILNYY